MLITFQILLVLFALFAIINVVRKYKEGLLGPKGALFWVLFWISVGVVVVWPNNAQKIADHIGIGRGADLVIYVSVAVIFYLLFRLNVKLEGLKRDLTKVVRDDTLAFEHLKHDNTKAPKY